MSCFLRLEAIKFGLKRHCNAPKFQATKFNFAVGALASIGKRCCYSVKLYFNFTKFNSNKIPSFASVSGSGCGKSLISAC